MEREESRIGGCPLHHSVWNLDYIHMWRSHLTTRHVHMNLYWICHDCFHTHCMILSWPWTPGNVNISQVALPWIHLCLAMKCSSMKYPWNIGTFNKQGVVTAICPIHPSATAIKVKSRDQAYKIGAIKGSGWLFGSQIGSNFFSSIHMEIPQLTARNWRV